MPWAPLEKEDTMKRNILTTSFLISIFVLGVNGQEFDLTFDSNCDRLVVPAKCQAVRQQMKDEIERLDDSTQRFQDRLRGAGPNLKAQLLRIIRQQQERRKRLSEDVQTVFLKCLVDSGMTPRRLAADELTARLTGTAVLQIDDSNTPDPFTVDIDVDLTFSRNRCSVSITRFPKLKLRTKDLPVIGRIDVEVTRTGGGPGSFHPVTGELSVPLSLDIHYDTTFLSDDDATFLLTTGNSVSRSGGFNVTGSGLSGGRITLVGTTLFRNGYLDRKEGSLVISARLSPQP